MKKILLLSFVLVALIKGYSQVIPNAGFENWSGNEPTTWGTNNATLAQLGQGPVVTQATSAGDFNSGTSAIKLATITITNPFTQQPSNVPGIAVSDGTVNITTTPPSITGGFPYTERPDSLVGYSRYVNGGGDQGNIIAIFTRWNGTSRDTLGSVIYNPTNATMQRFATAVSWTITVNPDSAQIILSSSGQTAVPGSQLFVDDLDFAFIPTAPTVTTTAATSVASTSATIGGNVTSDGHTALTEKGVYWSTTPGTAVSSGTKVMVTPPGGNGTFSTNLSGLTASTTYYYVAYAINSVGTAYGSELQFTTSAPPQCNADPNCTAPSCPDTAQVINARVNQTFSQTITLNMPTTATLQGYSLTFDSVRIDSITKLPPGIANWYTECGLIQPCKYLPGMHCLMLQGIPTTPGTYTIDVNSFAYLQVTGIGPYNTPQVAHYIISVNGLPNVTTTTVTSITANSATTGGNVVTDSNSVVTARGVVYSTSPNPTLGSATNITGGSGTGTFTSSLSGLNQLTTYYVRAYATNANGTVYGSQLTFTTPAFVGSPATITTTTVGIINTTMARSGGTITNDGGTTVTARGIVWDINPSPTVALTTKTSNGTGMGAFTSTLTPLVAGTTYYVRAYATNSYGTAYGNQVTYKAPGTLSCTPDPGITTAVHGIFPKKLATYDTTNLTVNQTFTYSLPFTFVNEKGEVQTADSSHLDQVMNIPSGLSVQCGRPSCMFYPGEVGCFTISGTLPNVNDQVYNLIFVLTDYGITQSATNGPQYSNTYAPGYKSDTVLIYVTSDSSFVSIESFDADEFEFVQASPNPFNDLVTVRFNSPKSEKVQFSIIDMYGREVFSVPVEAIKGLNKLEYFGDNIEAGIYYFSLSNSQKRITRKMIAIK